MLSSSHRVRVSEAGFEQLDQSSNIREVNFRMCHIGFDLQEGVAFETRNRVSKLILVGVLPCEDKVVGVTLQFDIQLCDKQLEFSLVPTEFIGIWMCGRKKS